MKIKFCCIGTQKLSAGDKTLFRIVFLQVLPSLKMDVMVWFHGGGFVSGAGSFYGPDYLLDKDIVLVTVNYRLGPIGKAVAYFKLTPDR
jgi:carboxylesterase type B